MAILNSQWPFMHLLILLLYITITRNVIAGKVPAVIVFGDSSVDSGNNNVISTVLKSNFPPYGRDFFGGRPTGRFSNGRVAPDFISEAFGLKKAIPAYLDPMYNMSDFATGVCFASAGTGYDTETSNVLNVIPLWKELDYYKEYQTKLRSLLGEAKANQIITESLYIVSVGTNDFLENYYGTLTRRNQFSDVRQFENFLVGRAETFMRDLYGLGVRKVSFTGVLPMGCLPLERTTNFFGLHECNEEYNDVALEFNGKLRKMVDKLNGELAGLQMLFSNPYGMFHQMLKKPARFGFEVTGVACCATGMYEMSYLCNQNNPLTCEDASKYIFWDSFHPTEKSNSIVAQHFIPSLLSKFS